MLLNYLPNFMQDIEEIKKIMDISEIELNSINKNTDAILKDFFVIGSSEEGTKHYEKMLEIIPKLTDSLKKRQYDILSIYNQTLPFTLKSLKEKLNAICGEDGYTIELLYESFILNVNLERKKEYLFITVSNLLEWIVPVNLIINLNLNFNTWKSVSNFKWGEVTKYTWEEIKKIEIGDEDIY